MMAQRRREEREGEGCRLSLKLKILEDRNAVFEIDGITPSVANAIRRTIVADVPKLAIHNVKIHHGQIRDKDGNVYDSSMPLFDEIVAHRLGLVPLKTDLKMNFREECSCGGKGCPLCTVTYSINKLGPCTVMSGDLLPLGNPNAVPADNDIPIVKLGKGQAMLVSAEAIMGRGSQHAKWQATSGVSYKYHREYILDKKIFSGWKEVSEAYPESVVENSQKRLVLTDDYQLRGLSSLVEMPGVEVIEDSSRFIFRFETDGSLTAREVLEYSLKRLPQRLNLLLESISGYGD